MSARRVVATSSEARIIIAIYTQSGDVLSFANVRNGMKLLTQCLAIGSAGFIGAIARHLVGTYAPRVFHTSFPVGTLIVNLTGCLAIGWFYTYAGSRLHLAETTRLAIAVGFIGTYTTFSTFAFESNALIERGSVNLAILNLVGSLILGLAAVRAGIWLGTR
jgi:CrcB protein